MALAQKRISSKKQAILTLMMAGVLLTTGLVIYFGVLKKDEVAIPTEIEQAPVETQAIIRPNRSSLDELETLYALPAFARLKQFGLWPLSIEPKGNPEPFLILRKEAGNKNKAAEQEEEIEDTEQ